MARRFVSPRSIPRTKRGNVWIGLYPSTGPISIAAASQTFLGSLNAAALALRPFTVVRTRMLIGWLSDQLAASESPFGAFSMQVVTDQAVSQGIAALPTPTTETDADFFVYEPLGVQIEFGDATGFDSHAGYWTKVDSKAMRTVKNNQDVAMVAEVEAVTFGAQIIVAGRMLVKLL